MRVKKKENQIGRNGGTCFSNNLIGYFLKLVRTSRPLLWFTHFTLFIYGGLQSHNFHPNSFQFIFGLFGLAGHLMGAVLDIEPDRKDNVRTSAVFFGVNKTVSFCIIAFLICLYLARNSWLFMFFMSVSVVICSFYYSARWRKSLFLPTLVAYLSLAFFVITIFLYFVSPNLLRI